MHNLFITKKGTAVISLVQKLKAVPISKLKTETMLRKISLFIMAGFSITSAYSQDSAEIKSPLLISGFVDAYYRFNFSNPKSDQGFNNFTSFTNSHNSFELGMASVKLEHSMGKVGFVADLGFGKRAAEFSYNERVTTASIPDASDLPADVSVIQNNEFAIKQAYITYAPIGNLKFTAGSWATHIGYELVDAPLNRNYSMGYMFSYGPFFHTGVKADLTAGKSGFMLGIANPTDLKSASFAQKFALAQYSYAGEKIKLYLNYQGGNFGGMQKMKQVDAVVTGVVTDKFSIGYNGTISMNKYRGLNGKYDSDASNWWGSALYLNVDPTSTFGVTLRGEYLDNEDGVLGLPTSVFETTLSLNFKVGGLTIIPELRLDNAKEESFIKRDGTTTKSTASALVAAVYKF